jgi:hypothetical protein
LPLDPRARGNQSALAISSQVSIVLRIVAQGRAGDLRMFRSVTRVVAEALSQNG